MSELNGCEPMEIKVPSPYTFTIGDTTKMEPYVSGGVATQVWTSRMSALTLDSPYISFGG